MAGQDKPRQATTRQDKTSQDIQAKPNQAKPTQDKTSQDKTIPVLSYFVLVFLKFFIVLSQISQWKNKKIQALFKFYVFLKSYSENRVYSFGRKTNKNNENNNHKTILQNTWACPFLPLLTPDVGKGPKYWKSLGVQRKIDVAPEIPRISYFLQ